MHSSREGIGRDDAITMLAQMDEMRGRLFALHPDLKSSTSEIALLPGAVDQSDAAHLSGSNPKALIQESPGSKFPVTHQGFFADSPITRQAPSTYQASSALGSVPTDDIVSIAQADVLSESESRAIKELIRSQLNAAHEAEAIKELIRSEVNKHTAAKASVHGPLMDESRTGSTSPVVKHLPRVLETPTCPKTDIGPQHDNEDDENFLSRTGSAPDGSNTARRKKGEVPERRKRSMEAIDDHTGALYPATAVAPGGGHHDSDAKDDGWSSTAENAYGAFIHTTLQSGLGVALYKCGPMLVTSVLIQFVFSYELYRALPSVESAPMFCQIPWDLQMAAILVFVTLMLDNISGMYSATRISLGSHQARVQSDDDAQPVELTCGWPTRTALFCLAVVTEIGTWFGIFGSGILFILTAESVDLVIRSTVAIMFVQNVDEIIFESCCSRQVKDSLRATQYKAVDPLVRAGVRRGQTEAMEHCYSLFLHLPVIFVISGGIVLGLRATEEIDCLVI